MTPLTIVCLLVHGEYPFTPDYVRRLKAMADRWCARPFRFVCLTDQADALPADVEAIPIEKWADCYALWSKLQIFDPRHGLTGRMLYIDLDTLIVAPLDPIIDFPADLALTTDALVIERAALTTDRHGRTLHRRFNSSVIVWDGGTQSHLCTGWTIDDARRLSTDQDWIGEQAPHAKGLPLEWFPRLSRLGPPDTWPPVAKVVLTKKPKNDQAVTVYPWFNALWGGWAA